MEIVRMFFMYIHICFGLLYHSFMQMSLSIDQSFKQLLQLTLHKMSKRNLSSR